jgi:hypothetical protein
LLGSSAYSLKNLDRTLTLQASLYAAVNDHLDVVGNSIR